ncbi:hypothetical protein [Jatrophihabitans sp.]|uniref:hypothetical protein n=1 Tax=Jatrophihabitans sp. TaxID=1932789 RepID=UPI0030C6B07B|nr:putative secreted protein [Jatrophihabitans sp.]
MRRLSLLCAAALAVAGSQLLLGGTAQASPSGTTHHQATTSKVETVSAVPATTLSIGASVTITKGHSTTIGTHLRLKANGHAVHGSTIYLYSRANSSHKWAKVTSKVTSSSGAATYSVKPSATTQYEWSYPGTSLHGKSTSHVETVTVKKPSSPPPAGCYPLTNSGNCYEPGEYCRSSDHGVTGVAGDGEAIRCEDNNGWRWEPI